MSLVQKGLLVFAVLVFFQIGLFLALYDQHVHLIANEEQTRHSLLANLTLSNALRSTLGLLDLVRTTDRQVINQQMIDSSKTTLEHLIALKQLYKDERRKLPTIDHARLCAQQCLTYFERALSQWQTGKIDLIELNNVFGQIKTVSNKLLLDIDSLIGMMSDEQENTKAAIASQQASRQTTLQLLGFGTLAELIFLVGFFGWFKQDTESRFNRLMENSDLLVQRKPLLPLMSSKDEFGEIDASLHQISEALQQSQEREQATIEHARDLICRIGADLVIAQSNQAVLDLLGYKVHQYVGKELKEIVHPDDAEQVIAQFRQNRTERELPFEARLVSKAGRPIETLWSVRWSSREHSFICVVHDITVQKQAERFRQEVVQMVSHDLKTPLFTVSSFLEMAESGLFGELDQEGQETINHAFQSCAQMLALIKDLLDIEKIKAGMLTIEPSRESIGSILQAAAEPVKSLAAQQNVTLQVLGPDIQVYADPDRLAQILTNLLRRAIASSPEGTAVTLRSTSNREFSQIDIIDGGSQPNVEALQAMFAGFQNFDSSPDGKLALDLPVSQALVELHGGVVRALKEGESCRFMLKLPTLAPEESAG